MRIISMFLQENAFTVGHQQLMQIASILSRRVLQWEECNA